MEEVILVDKYNNTIGFMEKIEAHQKGLLHRAFSIFILNSKNEILLQRRALDKYHSGGLWTNTCCSHPRKNETILDAANRRLFEEMGMKGELTKAFEFIYKAKLNNELTEHEHDTVFIGVSDSLPKINLNEVCDFAYISINDLENDIENNSAKYTFWLKACFKNFKQYSDSLINKD